MRDRICSKTIEKCVGALALVRATIPGHAREADSRMRLQGGGTRAPSPPGTAVAAAAVAVVVAAAAVALRGIVCMQHAKLVVLLVLTQGGTGSMMSTATVCAR